MDGSHTALLRRSALGLPRVYNNLPVEVVSCATVRDFQRVLQDLVKAEAKAGKANWQSCWSPRNERVVRFANC